MTSTGPEIVFITEHYHFLKILPRIQVESKMFRREKLERQTRKVIIKFSKHDMHSLTNYLPEEPNESMAWITLAIAECSKIKKWKKNLRIGTKS
jgi:hypothetical protein